MQTPALIAFDEDIKSRSWSDWLLAHVSFGKPLYRYEGVLSADYNTLRFQGRDKRSKQNVIFRIGKNEITQLYLGFDKIFNASETRGMGLTWLPLRLTLLTDDEKERYLYLITNYNFGKTDNQQWFTWLQNWLS